MVAAGLVVGLLTGGFPPEYSRDIQQLALILAMGFSLTEISFQGISPKGEARNIAAALLMSYGVLGGLVLLYAGFSTDPDIRNGWVLMAAVPPAVLVVPLTSLLHGDVRASLISDAVLYLLGLLTVPGLCFLFLGQAVPIEDLVIQTLLLIGVPIVVSRPLRRWSRIHDVRTSAVSVTFFFLVLAIAGSARGELLGRPDLVAGLAGLAMLRTFGLGLVIFGLTRALRLSRKARIATVAFAGFKNLGLTVVLAASFFTPTASLPAIVSLIFEILWLSSLPLLFLVSAVGVTEIPE